MNDLELVNFPNIGFLKLKLSNEVTSYLWKCIDNHQESANHQLVGHLHKSFALEDKDNWFFETTLKPLSKIYSQVYENIGSIYPTSQQHPYFLAHWWVNFQRQTEFNPLHGHAGVYSFVIWMKIPTDFVEQNQHPIARDSNNKKISAFEFRYLDVLGRLREFAFHLNPSFESTLLFFPSQLQHTVYPFFNCDEDRISISGNIWLNTDVKDTKDYE